MPTQSGGLFAALGLLGSSAAMYCFIIRAQPQHRCEPLPTTPRPRMQPKQPYFRASEKVLVMRASAGSG